MLCLSVCAPPKAPSPNTKSHYFIPRSPLPSSFFPSPSSSLFSSSPTGLYRNPARHRSSFYLYFGRHSRYLVSCLTAGAKRCVGFGPPFSSPLFSIDFPHSSRWFLPVPGSWVLQLNDTTTCKNNPDFAHLPISLPRPRFNSTSTKIIPSVAIRPLFRWNGVSVTFVQVHWENSVGRYPCFVGVSLGLLSVRSP